jgi:hypothetical protein
MNFGVTSLAAPNAADPAAQWTGATRGPHGKYVYTHQPTKFAAIEARWQRQQPGTEVWFAIPDEVKRRNLFAIESPGVGSFIATGTWTAPVYGLSDYPEADWPPVVIPFFTFRIMVGMGLVMLAISWFGNWLRWRGRLDTTRWFLWCASLAFPAGFVRTQRLVHRRGRAPALGCVGTAADRRCDHADPDRSTSTRDAHWLRRRLYGDLRVRHALHLCAGARRSDQYRD